jgi:hypothetical protein
VSAAEEFAAGGATGAGWQMVGGLAICAVGLAAAVLAFLDGSAGRVGPSGPVHTAGRAAGRAARLPAPAVEPAELAGGAGRPAGDGRGGPGDRGLKTPAG